MRITGGMARGIPLTAPKQGTTRPATDYLREAIFSSLGPIAPEDTFLDLFAGTGAYGLEALSRGAKIGTFVEKDRKALECLQTNLQAVSKSLQTGSAGSAQVAPSDVLRFLRHPPTPATLVFMDPPYEMSRQSLSSFIEAAAPWLANNSDARLIAEIPGDLSTPELPALKLLKRLGKGGKDQPAALIYRRA